MIKFIFFTLLLAKALSAPNVQTMAQLLVKGLTPLTYNLHTNDTQSLQMDCLKALYHEDIAYGVFHSRGTQPGYSGLYYAEQTDQKGWTNSKYLSSRGSQGTIFQIDDSPFILVAYELENHEKGNTMALRFYENIDKLRNDNILYEYQLNQIIDGNKKVRNIGTPSISKAQLTKSQSQSKYNSYYVEIKFHYSPDGSHDLPGEGFVNFVPLRDFTVDGKWVGGCKEAYSDWKGFSDTNVEKALKTVGCEGKIGQRDFFTIEKTDYYIYECNLYYQFDWKNWRIFMYSPSQRKAIPLDINLNGVVDLANPHVSLKRVQNDDYQFMLTFFLPSEGIPPSSVASAGPAVTVSRFTL